MCHQCAALLNPAKGLVGGDGKVRIRLKLQCTSCDM